MDHIVENLIGSLLDAQHDYAEESIDSLKNDRKEVYIFGAGAAGKLIKQDLDRFEIQVYLSNSLEALIYQVFPLIKCSILM